MGNVRRGTLMAVMTFLFLLVACQPAESPTPQPSTTQTPASPVVSTPTPSPQPPTATAASSPIAAVLPACGASSAVSSIETPVPVTPTAVPPITTPTASTVSPTPRPPTPTPRPAPQEDRIGFPEGYRTTFKQFYVFDRLDAKSVSYVCGNEVAASVKPGEPLPYGSVLVFESWRPKEDAASKVILDSDGHLIRQTLNAIFVMKKERGFGDAYQNLRTGEWEYVAYRPDKSYQTPPQNTAVCAACHKAVPTERDFVFRLPIFFTGSHYAQSPLPAGPNEAQMSRMAFFPNTLTVKSGTTVKWTNSAVDGIDHTATSSAGTGFDSGILKPGQSFSYTFGAPGTFAYVCTLHPEQMRGTVRVTE